MARKLGKRWKDTERDRRFARDGVVDEKKRRTDGQAGETDSPAAAAAAAAAALRTDGRTDARTYGRTEVEAS